MLTHSTTARIERARAARHRRHEHPRARARRAAVFARTRPDGVCATQAADGRRLAPASHDGRLVKPGLLPFWTCTTLHAALSSSSTLAQLRLRLLNQSPYAATRARACRRAHSRPTRFRPTPPSDCTRTPRCRLRRIPDPVACSQALSAMRVPDRAGPSPAPRPRLSPNPAPARTYRAAARPSRSVGLRATSQTRRRLVAAHALTAARSAKAAAAVPPAFPRRASRHHPRGVRELRLGGCGRARRRPARHDRDRHRRHTFYGDRDRGRDGEHRRLWAAAATAVDDHASQEGMRAANVRVAAQPGQAALHDRRGVVR
jgi:hypothetical protein